VVALVAIVSVDDAAVLLVPVVDVAVVEVAAVSVLLVPVALAPVDETPVSTAAVSVLALLSLLQPNAHTRSSAHTTATNDLFIRTISRQITGGKPGRGERCPLNVCSMTGL